ncbi:unnamed protein product [Owenia fusiformis]|uniref:Peptidase M14 domain-containing protein n=1 Tax=Owenia fusiformis TaxID=6347 RepID=A0A8J1UVN1_OWEFU|nr:unnamed protein product [Owenia fusiformis]
MVYSHNKMVGRFALLVLLVTCCCAAKRTRYDGYNLLKVTSETADQHNVLRHIHNGARRLGVDFWTEPSKLHNDVLILIAPRGLKYVLTRFIESGIKYDVVSKDIQSVIDSREAKRKTSTQQGQQFFTDYRTPDEIYAWLNSSIGRCPSGVTCSLLNIGSTYEGRPLQVFKLSTGDGRRKIWLDGGIHAREWISPATVMYVIEQLLTGYGTDASVTPLLDNYDWYIMPLINVDGYLNTWNVDRMWRKTMSPTWDEDCIGTDANRNFDHMWNSIGTNDDPCAQTYAGETAFSEVEALAVGNFIMPRASEFISFITVHSAAQLLLLPWGYTSDYTPDYDELMRVGNAWADAIEDNRGTIYPVGTSNDILYPSSGTSRDWAKGVPQIKYVYTVELPGFGWGFLLPPEEIIPVGNETWDGFKAMVSQFQP